MPSKIHFRYNLLKQSYPYAVLTDDKFSTLLFSNQFSKRNLLSHWGIRNVIAETVFLSCLREPCLLRRQAQTEVTVGRNVTFNKRIPCHIEELEMWLPKPVLETVSEPQADSCGRENITSLQGPFIARNEASTLAPFC